MEGEQSEWHSTELQHVIFSFFKLQKEKFCKNTQLCCICSFLGLQNLLPGPCATVSAAKAKPCSGGMLSR